MEINDAARRLFRSFRRQYNLAYKIFPESGLQFNLSGSVKEPARASLAQAANEREFATVMRPFLDKDSPIGIRPFWAFLKEHFLPALNAEEMDRLDETIPLVFKGEIGARLNEQQLDQEGVYQLLSESTFFNDDEKAAKPLGVDPMKIGLDMLWWLFFDLNRKTFFLAKELDRLARRIELSGAAGGTASTTSSARCIYCLSAAGPFNSEEHVFPESLAGDNAVLPKGLVCDPCNHGVLSVLDQKLIEFPPLALLRVTVGPPLTKKGKFPKADFPHFSMEKTSPRNIRLNVKGKKDPVSPVQKHPDGTVSFQIQVEDPCPDYKGVGRALMKIALGMVAFDCGPERACDSVFDPVRSFIQGTGEFQNNFLMRPPRTPPKPEIICRLIDNEIGTAFFAVIYGVEFAISLREQPRFELDDELRKFGAVAIPLHGSVPVLT